MSMIDDIRRMKSAGQTDQAIVNSLSQQGVSDREISEAISQADIKQAVSGARQQNPGMTQQLNDSEQGMYETPMYQGEQSLVQQRGYEGMEPSMAAGEQVGGYQDYGATGGVYPAEPAVQGYGEPAVEQQYSNYGAGYPEYQQYQEGMSSDVITEIAEQVVSERMAQMRESLERTLDFRTVAEARIEGLNERLRRLEKIIDTLQLSILEKVGEYVGDVKHLKDELIETQKSFNAVHHHHEKK